MSPRYLISLALVEETSLHGAHAHNQNTTVEAEDEHEAINEAIKQAFELASASGTTLVSIHIARPTKL